MDGPVESALPSRTEMPRTAVEEDHALEIDKVAAKVFAAICGAHSISRPHPSEGDLKGYADRAFDAARQFVSRKKGRAG